MGVRALRRAAGLLRTVTAANATAASTCQPQLPVFDIGNGVAAWSGNLAQASTLAGVLMMFAAGRPSGGLHPPFESLYKRFETYYMPTRV